MIGSVIISQAMLALFRSPPDNPGIMSPPTTKVNIYTKPYSIYKHIHVNFTTLIRKKKVINFRTMITHLRVRVIPNYLDCDTGKDI